MAAPMLALEEEHRAEALAIRIGEILEHPSLAPTTLPQFQYAARDAFETAAANAEQPDGVPR